MDIEPNLVPVFQQIEFAHRYKKLCDKYSNFKQRFKEYDKERIQSFFEKKGLIISFLKKEKFFKIVEKYENFSFQLNVIPEKGFLQLVLNVKKGDKKCNLSYGMWESITKELIDVETTKPIFTNYKELEEILEESLNIYEDFKKEVIKL